MRIRRPPLSALGLLTAALACGSETTNPPPGGNTTPSAIAVASGNDQTATVSTQLPNPLVVLVTNSDADPLSGVDVDWSVTAGGGTLSATSTPTNAQGRAQVSYTVGAAAGTNTVRATVSGTSLTADFTATGTVAPPVDNTPASISVFGGNNQSETVGLSLQQPLEVRVRNASNQPLQGIVVAWQASGGGSLGSATSTTNASGVASNTYTLGTTAGAQTITASVESNPSITVDLTANAQGATATTSVSVDDNFFEPKGTSVTAGATVTWTWNGNLIHNVTWINGGFTASPDQSSGTHQQPLVATGTYRYYCTFHGTPTSGMRGVVIVE